MQGRIVQVPELVYDLGIRKVSLERDHQEWLPDLSMGPNQIRLQEVVVMGLREHIMEQLIPVKVHSWSP